MAHIFISYSRKDKVFVQRLFDRLKVIKLDTWVDWQGIPYGSEFWKEICQGIDSANAFVFVVSPDSLISQSCNMELEYARKNHKRIIPVIRREPDIKMIAGEWFGKKWETTARENWEELQKLNFVFFRKKLGFDCVYDESVKDVVNPQCDQEQSDLDNFEEAFSALVETTNKDLKYLEEHTRLMVRARDWVQHKSGLLRGSELASAEVWLLSSGGKSPIPTELHFSFISASRRMVRRSARIVVVSVTMALLTTMVLMMLSLSFFRNSRYNLDLYNIRSTEMSRQIATVEAFNALSFRVINLYDMLVMQRQRIDLQLSAIRDGGNSILADSDQVQETNAALEADLQTQRDMLDQRMQMLIDVIRRALPEFATLTPN